MSANSPLQVPEHSPTSVFNISMANIAKANKLGKVQGTGPVKVARPTGRTTSPVDILSPSNIIKGLGINPGERTVGEILGVNSNLSEALSTKPIERDTGTFTRNIADIINSGGRVPQNSLVDNEPLTRSRPIKGPTINR